MWNQRNHNSGRCCRQMVSTYVRDYLYPPSQLGPCRQLNLNPSRQLVSRYERDYFEIDKTPPTHNPELGNGPKIG